MIKKIHKLFAAAAVLLSAALPMKAEIVENYFYNFTKPIDSSDPAFAVASGWGHVVDSYVYSGTTYYQSYSVSAYSGKTKGALNIGAASVGSSWSKKTLDDIIVTPKVSGAVSLWVKSTQYSGGGSIKFYQMKKLEDGSYEKGAEYSAQYKYRLTSAWEEIVFDEIAEDAEYPYIGIHGDYAYICDFSAEKAEIEKQHKLSISTISTNALAQGLVCDENNMANIKLTVYVANAGDYSYEDDAENLTLDVRMAGSDAILKSFNIGAIAEGASKNVECVLDPIPFSEIGSSAVFSVTENISGSTKESPAMTIREYKPVVTFREATYSDVAADYVLNLGKTNKVVSKAMYLSTQSGTADAVITDVTCPAGFSISVTAPQTIAKNTRIDITIGFDPEGLEAGLHEGNIVLTVENGDPAILPVKVDLVDPSLIFIPFSDNTVIPDELINGSGNYAWKLDYSGYGDTRNNYLKPTSSSYAAELVLPKLTFSADKSLSIDVRKSANTAKMGLTFAYSADRTNWVELPDMTLNDRSEVALTYDFQTFDVVGVPEGDYYLKLTGYDVYIDNIYGLPYATVAHDLELLNIDIPASGMVNKVCTASVTLKNYKRVAEEAGSYSVVFVVGDQEFAVEDTPEVPASQGTATINTAFTPHAVADYEAYMEVRFNDETVYTTPVSTIGVVAETVEALKLIVPDVKTSSTSPSYVLPVTNNAKVFSEQIFPKEWVNLPAGTACNGIAFLGESPEAAYTTNLEVWIGHSSATVQNTDKTPLMSTDDLQKVYDGEFTFPKTETNDGWFFNIPFSENFVYDGVSSIVLYMRAIHPEGTTAKRVNFWGYQATDTDKWNHYRRWYINEDGSLGGNDNWFVGYASLNLVVETGVVSGHVMEGEVPVEGAAITLRSDDVEYYGTSDAEGAFSIDVLQATRDYTATAVAESFVGGESAVSFADDLNPSVEIAMLPTEADLFQGVYEAVVLPDVTTIPAGTYYQFKSIEGNKLVFKALASNSDVQAHTPYILLPDEDCVADLATLTFDHVADGVTVDGTTFQGTYASRVLRDGEHLATDLIGADASEVALQADAAAKIARASGAYIATDILNPAIELRSAVSGIENVDAEAAAKNGAVYTIDGRLVRANGNANGLPAGIYIVNGQKVAVK